MKTYKNIITDLDGTLVECAQYYMEVQHQFADFQHERTKLPWEMCLNILKKIDIECTSLPDAFGPHRFPRSFQAASYALDAIIGDSADNRAGIKSWYIGNAVFDAPYPLYRGVVDVLTYYRDAGFKLFLLTKGHKPYQMAKVIKNNLTEFFDKDNTYVVLKKTSINIKEIIFDHELDPTETLMVGDSERDDIASAIGAKIDSVLVSTGTPWDYERGHSHQPTYHILSFADLPNVISA